ncbi:MAG: tetratricopeptide repeat protein, partial [Coleofasciculus sp. C2-GNP5-27]
IQTNNLPGHEKAELWNLLGYTYYLLQDQARTKEYYTRVINEPEANAPLVMRTLKTVAQLHMMDEQWDLALRYYTEWMSFQQVVGASDYALLANIYYNMEDLDSSLENIEIAIEMRESNGEIAQENWYAIQKAISYEQRNFRKCIEILNKLIVNYPNVRYWRELGGMYAELEEEVEQMAAYHIAY